MNLKALIIGLSGIGALQVAPDMVNPDPAVWNEIFQVLIQIGIGIVTLFGLFKKKKP